MTDQPIPTDLTNAPTLLDVRGVTVEFVAKGQPPARAVEGVSFRLRKGEMLGLVGESGCGKTTLMLALLRLLPEAGRIASGQIDFMGRDLLALNEQQMAEVRWTGISIVFQGAMNALNPVRTVGDQIAEALVRHGTLAPALHSGASAGVAGNKKAAAPRVGELLELVGIGANRRNQYPHQYSGGMRQRAMIAMALACDPQVVIADEPTTALDVMIQAQILELLDTLRRQLGLAVILVTHDLGVVAEVCDTVLVMYGGVAAEYADVDTIFNDPQHPYTQRLLHAFPDLTRPDQALVSIPGYPPRLDALPPGCRFAPRCPVVFDRCYVEPPALYQLDAFHWASCHLVEPVGDAHEISPNSIATVEP